MSAGLLNLVDIPSTTIATLVRPVQHLNTDSSTGSIRFVPDISVQYAECGQYYTLEIEDPEIQYGAKYTCR